MSSGVGRGRRACADNKLRWAREEGSIDRSVLALLRNDDKVEHVETTGS